MKNENPLQTEGCMILGYYPMRGKAQMCRLLCEYLKLPYRDLLFTPKTWEQFKIENRLNWTFQQLPFLKDGDTIVTETYPICLYLLHKSGQKKLLGSTLLQQIKIDTQIWKIDPASYLVTSIVNHRDLSPEVKAETLEKLWSKFLNKKFQKLEKQAICPYFFGQISLLDFYIYETVYYTKLVTPQKLSKFPKLLEIAANFSNISQIKQYQNSKRAIKEVCPIKFCINWRERCGKYNNH